MKTSVKRFESKTFIERLYCECGKEMKVKIDFPDNVSLIENPKFLHVCENGHKAILDHVYPQVGISSFLIRIGEKCW